jgi:hypothetical protein
MPLTFVLDEHLRGPLWQAIQRHNQSGGLPIDAVRVGDSADLPLGTRDPEILQWAERHGRILVSLDRHTMPNHLKNHLLLGRHSPGVLLVDASCTMSAIVSALELAAHAGNPIDYADQTSYVP